MEALLCSKSIPPGVRFYPTDEELFMYYLKRKVLGKSLPEMIAEVDVYQFAPWELPPLACLKTKDLNWYFFCPRGKKYPNGGRANRATKLGYWKSTGNDRTMMFNSCPVGKIKTLIFHRGKPPKGDRTDWVMHEYRLEDKVLSEKGIAQESFVICKIYEKSGLGPRNGEHYGARFVEKDWDSDDDDNVQGRDLEVVPISMGPGVGNSPDGSFSALTTGVIPNVPSPSEFPAAVATAPVADIIYPDIATTFVGTQFTTAPVSTPLTAASLGTLNVATASVDTLNVVAASAGSACAFTSSVCSPSNAVADVACELDEIEVQRLLAYLVEDDNNTDIFSGLGDLEFPSGQLDLGWNDHLSMDDLM